MTKKIGSLSVRDLIVPGARGRVLLDVPSLKIEAGQTIGINGASGAGKSTLLLALAGLHQKQQGSVEWGEFDLASATASERTKFRSNHIGFVFQDFDLFEELDPLQNASIQALFKRKNDRNALRFRAKTSLDELGIKDLAKKVDIYSGGERQRISVARALAHKPSIILADEPTAHLDRKASEALANDLIRLARTHNRTLIVVSHDEFILKRFDKVISIEDGRLVS